LDNDDKTHDFGSPPTMQLHQPLGFGREFRRLHGAQVWQQSFSHQDSLLLHYKSEAAGQFGGSNFGVSCGVHSTT